MIDTDKYEEFENAMNEGRIERVHCLWALAEVKRLREGIKEVIDVLYEWDNGKYVGMIIGLSDLIE